MSYQGRHRKPKKKTVTHPRIIAVLCIVATVLAFSNIRFFREHVPGVSHIPPIIPIEPKKPHHSQKPSIAKGKVPQPGKGEEHSGTEHSNALGQEHGAPHRTVPELHARPVSFNSSGTGTISMSIGGGSGKVGHSSFAPAKAVPVHHTVPVNLPKSQQIGTAGYTGVGLNGGNGPGSSQTPGDSSSSGSGGTTTPSSPGSSSGSPSLLSAGVNAGPVQAQVDVASPNRLLSARVDTTAPVSDTGHSTGSTGSHRWHSNQSSSTSSGTTGSAASADSGSQPLKTLTENTVRHVPTVGPIVKRTLP